MDYSPVSMNSAAEILWWTNTSSELTFTNLGSGRPVIHTEGSVPHDKASKEATDSSTQIPDPRLSISSSPPPLFLSSLSFSSLHSLLLPPPSLFPPSVLREKYITYPTSYLPPRLDPSLFLYSSSPSPPLPKLFPPFSFVSSMPFSLFSTHFGPAFFAAQSLLSSYSAPRPGCVDVRREKGSWLGIS